MRTRRTTGTRGPRAQAIRDKSLDPTREKPVPREATIAALKEIAKISTLEELAASKGAQPDRPHAPPDPDDTPTGRRLPWHRTHWWGFACQVAMRYPA